MIDGHYQRYGTNRWLTLVRLPDVVISLSLIDFRAGNSLDGHCTQGEIYTAGHGVDEHNIPDFCILVKHYSNEQTLPPKIEALKKVHYGPFCIRPTKVQ